MVDPVLPRYLTTAEVADYLRLKPRKVYDLVRQGQIPCTRATGKLLFPRHAIDLWLMNHLEGDQSSATEPLEVMAGSQDPLLDWAMRESGCGLASLCLGSGDGIQRLLAGKAMVVGAHLLDGAGGYNVPSALGLGGMRDLVVVHWARRTQGLMLAPGNPLDVLGLSDLARPGLRIGRRPRVPAPIACWGGCLSGRVSRLNSWRWWSIRRQARTTWRLPLPRAERTPALVWRPRRGARGFTSCRCTRSPSTCCCGDAATSVMPCSACSLSPEPSDCGTRRKASAATRCRVSVRFASTPDARPGDPWCSALLRAQECRGGPVVLGTPASTRKSVAKCW